MMVTWWESCGCRSRKAADHSLVTSIAKKRCVISIGSDF